LIGFEPPHPNPLPRKSGLPDLRNKRRDPGKPGARGERERTESAGAVGELLVIRLYDKHETHHPRR